MTFDSTLSWRLLLFGLAFWSIPMTAIPTTQSASALKRQELAYGDAPWQKLDLYLPRTITGPLLIYVHGGAWISGSKDDYHGLGRVLAQLGFPAAIVDYRLSGENSSVRFPKHARDVAAAIAFLRHRMSKLGIGASALFVIGHSAGAHIAATLAMDPTFSSSAQTLSGFVGIEGIYDIPALVGRWPSYRDWFIKLAFGPDTAQWESASPQYMKSPCRGRWLLIHSSNDELVDPPQSKAFYRHLRNLGVPAQLDLSSRQSHFGVIQTLELPGDSMLKKIIDFVGAR